MRIKRKYILWIPFVLSCVLLYNIRSQYSQSGYTGEDFVVKQRNALQKRPWVDYKISENGDSDVDYSVDLNNLRNRGKFGLHMKRGSQDHDGEIELNRLSNDGESDDDYAVDLNDLRKKEGVGLDIKNNRHKHEEEIQLNTLESFHQPQSRDSRAKPSSQENSQEKSQGRYATDYDHEDYRDQIATSEPTQSQHFNDLQDKINFFLMEIQVKSDRDLLPTCSEPKQNFVYIKNHKCASDTLAAMFRRYGYVRNLTFVQPVRLFWNIGWPYRLKPHMYRAPKSQPFNILTEHTVYDRLVVSLMPPDAAYITSIREPFSRLQSAFPFFNYGFYSGIDEMTDASVGPLDFFLLSNKTYFDETYKHSRRNKVCVPQGLSTIRNFMSFELGLPVGFYGPEDRQQDMKFIKEWMQKTDDKFSMVILVEYFSESLVMLKRMMCWSAKDVLFKRLNTKRLHDAQPHFAASVVNSFLSWSFVDTLLYTHFNNTLWRRVRAMGSEDFFAEVEDFEHMQQTTMKFCTYILDNDHINPEALFRHVSDQSKPVLRTYAIVHQSETSYELVFHQSKWNPEIRITAEDCGMIFSEYGLREEIRKRYDDDPTQVEQPLPPGDGRPWGC